MAIKPKKNNNFESALFNTADKLRKNIDAAEYKNVVLGLIFLKYISDAFQELYESLEIDEYSDPEDLDEYTAENVFFVPKEARWAHLQAQAKLPEIGVAIDAAMSIIEKENKELKNVLPKVYAKPNLDKTALGQLIDVVSDIELKAENENSKDLLGRVYDPACGSGGMFVMSEKFVEEHQPRFLS